MSLRDSDSETSYSSNEDEDMQSVTADDLFEEDMPSKNCISSLGECFLSSLLLLIMFN